jgi:NADH-quinone oxidoreductase subunit L
MDSIEQLIILIPALPLLAVLVTATLGPRVLRDKSHWPTILALGAAFVLSLTLLMQVQAAAKHQAESGDASHVGYEKIVPLWNWATIDSAYEKGGESYNFAIDVVLRADTLTAVMLSMVTFISLLVAIYSRGYMHGESGYWRLY